MAPRFCSGEQFAMMEAVLLVATFTRRFRLEIERGPELKLRTRHPIYVRSKANDQWSWR
jgi:cytochrome P450